MAVKKLPEGEELTDLIKHYRFGAETVDELARKYHVNLRNFQRYMRSLGIYREIPNSTMPRYDSPLIINRDTLYLPDAHIPYHDAGFINNCIKLALSWGISVVVLDADATDSNALAKFSNLMNKPDVTIEAEMVLLEDLIERLSLSFGKIYMLWANHLQRFLRLIEEQITPQRLTRLFDPKGNITVTEYYQIKVHDFMLAHPRNVSVIGGRIPQLLAEKYETHCIGSHGHLWGLTLSKSGTYIAVDSGACADPMRLDWATLRPNTRPKMVTGAVIIKRGLDGKVRPFLLHPEWTDWEAMKRLYPRKDGRQATE